MNIYEQYLAGDLIDVEIPLVLNNKVLQDFTFGHVQLLREKDMLGDSFLQEVKKLNIIIKAKSRTHYADEDFDILFLSYLTLLKFDFPNLDISIRYPSFSDDEKLQKYYYQLEDHRKHLKISTGIDIYSLYKGSVIEERKKVQQSSSYIPPIFINPESIKKLFAPKKDEENHEKKVREVFGSSRSNYESETNRKNLKESLNEKYQSLKGNYTTWNYADLSGLYMTETLFDLYILRHLINPSSGYQIGNSLKDKTVALEFRRLVYKILAEGGVFNFSDIEAYFFSLLVRKNKNLQVPTSFKRMLSFLSPDLNEAQQQYFTDEDNQRELQRLFIRNFGDSLRKTIQQVKDACYGLEELAKNVIEHTEGRQGVITGRIYSKQRLKLLKNLPPEWVEQFCNQSHFLDINIVDAGHVGIKEKYIESLIREQAAITDAEILESEHSIRDVLQREYQSDIQAVEHYQLDDFYNFDTVQLYHQVNRTKARLGLLIFAQTVLHEKRGFINVASNGIFEEEALAYSLYANLPGINKIKPEAFIKLGTNYNFIVPIDDAQKETVAAKNPKIKESSSSSSVFSELHRFPDLDELHFFRPVFDRSKLNSLDKYSKLSYLKSLVIQMSEGKLCCINAADLKEVLENSSDWVRFLANLQFSTDFLSQVIIYNLDVQTYAEFLTILELFDKIGNESMGFWKAERFVLFFIPIAHGDSTYWFNSLLCATKRQDFLAINNDLDKYHHNLIRVMDVAAAIGPKTEWVPMLNGDLFSSNGQLLNFELLIKYPKHGITLFEHTVGALLNLPINQELHEN